MVVFIKAVIRLFLCKIFYKVEFVNKEIEEKFDKCILCPNHSNKCEPAWIYANTNDISIMAKAELFENKIMAKLYNYFGIFPIRRGEHDVRSLIHAINLFKNVLSRKLLIFPEGERVGRNEERGTAKVGPLYIAYKANIPIIPMYITKDAKIFSKVKIIYGEPMYVTKEIVNDKEKLKVQANKLLDKCYKLNKGGKNECNIR